MIRAARHLLAMAAAIALVSGSARCVGAAETGAHNDTARFLAGLPPAPTSRLAAWTSESSWQQHAAGLNAAWGRLEREQLGKIRTWSGDYLGTKRPVLYYMFSGPDFLYADAFFPDALTYVLSGLEPVGPVPQVTESNRRSIGRLRNALSSILSLSFFKTISMRSDLGAGAFSGTLPILAVFLARSGKTIEEISLVQLDASGAIVAAGAAGSARGVSNGAKIVFSGPDREPRTLYYFQTDVSNSGPGLGAFLEFCGGLGTGDALVKSASFLMHSDSFSRVRGFLLDRAHAIVQDDSGIPVRFFRAEEWVLVPFGRYLGPISLFSGQYQNGLADLYRRQEPISLEFGIGYRYQKSESNLLMAVRKPQ